MFHVWVIVYEEPSLESLFGEGFRRDRRAVPRWCHGEALCDAARGRQWK